MSYELHIESREEPFFDFDQWQMVVDSLPEVRPHLPHQDRDWPGDVEMCFEGEWVPVFQWSDGTITFQLGNYPKAVLKAAFILADRMNGLIRGDEGEEYTSWDDLAPLFGF
jgi:hypothetical protein